MKLLKIEIRSVAEAHLETQFTKQFRQEIYYKVWERVYDPIWVELNHRFIYLIQERLDEIS